MRILVAYGSKHGGTEGLAAMVAGAFRARGLDAEAIAARRVATVRDYDAVVVGGSLYAGRWHRDARRFVRHHHEDLRSRPVWLFSSGPLDDSAPSHDIEPVGQVRKAMEAVGARGHATFGGRLAPDAKGFPASAMAKNHAGDWRDPEHVARWAATVADALVPANT